jgi:hypothetical protein
MVAMTLTSLAFTSELKKKEFTDCMNILTTESTPDLNNAHYLPISTSPYFHTKAL